LPIFRGFGPVPPFFFWIFVCQRIELKKLPIMANFGSVTSLPSGSNRAKVSPSNRNRPFFAPESPIFCPIQSFSSIKCLDSDRAQNFTLCKIVFAEIWRFLSAWETQKVIFGTYKVVKAANGTKKFHELS
jgi:hypothetical protein